MAAHRPGWSEARWYERPLGFLGSVRGAAVLAGAAVTVAVAVTLAVLSQSAAGPPARARQYLAFTACLLTGPGGLAGSQAAAAWAGMEKASVTAHVRVQYLAVASGTTAGAAAPYLDSLTTRHCGVVVASGAAQVAAVTAAAGRYRSIRFAVLGSGVTRPNVTVMRGPAAAVRSAVAALIRSAAGGGR